MKLTRPSTILLWMSLLILLPVFVQCAQARGLFRSLAGSILEPVVPTGLPIPDISPVLENMDPITLHVGWTEHPKGLTFSNDLPTLLGGITNVRQRPLKGLWLYRRTTITPLDRLRLTFTSATLFSCEPDGSIISSIGRTADFEGDGTEWYYCQAVAEWDFSGPLKVLAGFRWDYTTSRLHVTRAPRGYDDFIVNGYMPLIGFRVSDGSPRDGVEIRVLGFPCVPGNIKFHTWEEASQYSQESFQSFTRGHYLEILAEYRKRIFNMDLSVFGRWDLLHASTDVERALVPAPVLDIKWTFDRRSWTIGLGLSYDFNLL